MTLIHFSAGAMRVPRVHFLAMGYFKRFNIETVKWMNYNPKTYLYLYGEKIRTEGRSIIRSTWIMMTFIGNLDMLPLISLTDIVSVN